MVGGIDQRVGGLVAGINRADHAVVGIGVDVVLATQQSITAFNTRAVQVVVAAAVVDRVDNYIVDLIAAVVGATHAVVGNRIGVILAVENRVAGLNARAELPVGAKAVVDRVDYYIIDLVAAVVGAAHAVVGDRVSVVHAAQHGIATLNTRAEKPVIADRGHTANAGACSTGISRGTSIAVIASRYSKTGHGAGRAQAVTDTVIGTHVVVGTRSCRGHKATARRAAVTVEGVAVVALLPVVDKAVATGINRVTQHREKIGFQAGRSQARAIYSKIVLVAGATRYRMSDQRITDSSGWSRCVIPDQEGAYAAVTGRDRRESKNVYVLGKINLTEGVGHDGLSTVGV